MSLGSQKKKTFQTKVGEKKTHLFPDNEIMWKNKVTARQATEGAA
jgi:hypothetical protein